MKWPLAVLVGVLFAGQLALSFAQLGDAGLIATGLLRFALLIVALFLLVRAWMERRGLRPGTNPNSAGGNDEAIPSAADAARRRLWGS